MEEGFVTYDPGDPEKLEKAVFEKKGLKLTGLFNPKRLERYGLASLADEILDDPALIFDFEEYGLAMLPNAKPILPYHSLLFKRTNSNIPQNSFTIDDLKNASACIEKIGARGFMNMMRGAAASYDRWHCQLVFDRFPIEDYPVKIDKDQIGYIDYPAGNLLITGNLEDRINILSEMIGEYRANFTKWDMVVLKKDNAYNEKEAIFSLLMYENKILFVPRRREVPEFDLSDASGGLELGGIFCCSTSKAEFEHLNYRVLENALKSVSYPQELLLEKFSRK